ncbi:phosphoribosylaminoimidazolesuccinocarboxamide synthase [Candidatus Peregrinibacteria bacterium RIFOXYC2_FULL_33_13]|nr:MAG: Phosphoribosylaminoimidazole-succinocarboxamide synthase [Candidatus Peregrinibacteria bacterium GW2011_GWA2_33_10]KKP39783.1 MAG: phosphoribosylaminoimidazolesuccinocarboxamide synthase, phosphoribosylaminoimidazole-succinocarboxamide synthase [Candidatus Peregrinibacteria bacterium GW2011_GWC2_33_13]OGJ48234.1 MAG: phosphoribosylaminoimidazolesuccinocarboxamide synthase [Candidatus Peregrinibacteria bacterium RIFOXYA2_FULL_33_7]OGJ52186.1 MAG: phosphoribosylaminoimidazolesuccinocarboxa
MLDIKTILAQIPFCLQGTDFSNLGIKYQGKVRDNYTQGYKRILIATDRLSAFDRIICTIPFKGQVLNRMAQFWFDKTKDIVQNHAISYPDPNVIIGKECKPLALEMVVRGYLTGVTSTSAWYNYERGVRNFCGNILPDGMKKNQKFDTPILTPSTKAEKGDHDESISPDELIERGIITEDLWDKLADISLKLFQRGVEICAKQGIILVDTKYEFGFDENGDLTLIDEIHTPDSSRFWFESEYEIRFMEGIEQKKIDKEYLREWLAERGFRGEGEIPMIPEEVRAETARRYIEAYKLITGQSFDGNVGDVTARIKENLRI